MLATVSSIDARGSSKSEGAKAVGEEGRVGLWLFCNLKRITMIHSAIAAAVSACAAVGVDELHERGRAKPPCVHYLNPFSVDKN